jgi:Peptidase S24-like
MKKTASQRLRERRKDLGYKTATDAARRHGWNISTYRSHENDSRGTGIPKWAAEDYAKTYKVSLDWLMTGVERRSLPLEKNLQLGLAVRHVPLLTWDIINAALSGQMALDNLPQVPVATDNNLGNEPISVRLPDASMVNRNGNKSFHIGDILVFNRDAKTAPGEYCLAEVEDSELPVFRKYTEEGKDRIKLVPLNPDFPSYAITLDKPGLIIGRLMVRQDEF